MDNQPLLPPENTETREPDKNPSLWSSFKRFLRERFNLDDDKASEDEIRDNIRKGVDLKGANLWILVCAIILASIGLNVNSVAVIIGAMLISPLMGPIMGIGLALGVSNFELMKRSFKNLGWAALMGLLTSTLYFAVSPLSAAQSEILARTTPTIWDVLIALFGGLAGIIAQTRRDRITTVIPGVAIATALMPPLCTAGYGLAIGNMSYFVGAFYLFFINAVFIALAAFAVVRFMGFRKVELVDPRKARHARNLMTLTVVLTVVPSIFMAYDIVQRTIFENNANRFIKEVLVFERTEVVGKTIKYESKNHKPSQIEVWLVGTPVSDDALALARNQLGAYGLTSTELTVRQAAGSAGVDSRSLQHLLTANLSILDEKNREITQLRAIARRHDFESIPSRDILHEMRALWGYDVCDFGLSRTERLDSAGHVQDTLLMCSLQLREGTAPLTAAQREALTVWLAARTKTPNVKLIVE